MPVINPDTSAAIEMGPIEPGTYKAKIEAVTFQMSKNGNPMIKVLCQVDVDGKPRPRTSYLVISGPGSYGFDQLLRATGFDEIADTYRDPSAENPSFDTDELVGQDVQVVIDRELFEGTARDNIKSFLKL